MNVIRHTRTGLKVRQGDHVTTPDGIRVANHTTYSGRNGARVWVDMPKGSGIIWKAYAASECCCYVTSED